MSVYHLKWILLFGVMVIPLPVSATTPIFRCQKDGQTVLTDRPCDAPPSGGAAVSTTSPNGEVAKSITALPTVVGDWGGQTQFQVGMNGVRVAEAQSVVPMILTLSADGKVTGTSPDNGCKVLVTWGDIWPAPFERSEPAGRNVGFPVFELDRQVIRASPPVRRPQSGFEHGIATRNVIAERSGYFDFWVE